MRMRFCAGQLHWLLGVPLIIIIGLTIIGFTTTAFAQTNASASFKMPHSRSPLGAYSPDNVPEPQLTNSPRLGQLIRDGKLYLSLKDAISLALENNLDLAIARYNLPIADMDILRTKAGGIFRGVNAGIVQGTPGGGVGGCGPGAPGVGGAALARELPARVQAARLVAREEQGRAHPD